MLGLPTETEEDMQALPDLSQIRLRDVTMRFRRNSGMENVRLQPVLLLCAEAIYSVPVGADVYEKSILEERDCKHAFKEQLNRKSLKYNWHDADVTVLEGILARGDRKVAKVIEEGYRLGCYLRFLERSV